MSLWRSPHDHPAPFSQKRKALWIAIGLSCAAFVLQMAGAWYTGSLALLGDTAHLFTDLFSLVMSLVALVLAARPTNNTQSFGLYRLEVLAAFLNGILLLVVGIGLVWEGAHRLLEPQTVLAIPLLVVSTIGLLFNLLSALFLSRALKAVGDGAHSHSHEHGHNHSHEHHSHHSDRNLQSALLHVMSDALSSVAVMIGAVLVYFTQWFWVDALLGLGLGLVILRWAYHLLWDSGHVLIEATPKHVNPQLIHKELHGLDKRVKLVEDLHVWEITSRMYAATAEVRVEGMTLDEAEALRARMQVLLREKFGIAHVVLAMRP